MLLAQNLIDGAPLMFNHHRGLWGYVGTAKTDGLPLLVQATGVGGTSLAAVAGELIDLGVRQMVRVGTCTATDQSVKPAALIAVTEAIGDDGASRSVARQSGFEGSTTLRPDERLHAKLLAALNGDATEGTVRSVDSPTDTEPAGVQMAIDFQTATLFALAAANDFAAAAILVAAGSITDGPLDDQALERSVLAGGQAAARALSD
jgi:uridine phosphorylase